MTIQVSRDARGTFRSIICPVYEFDFFFVVVEIFLKLIISLLFYKTKQTFI